MCERHEGIWRKDSFIVLGERGSVDEVFRAFGSLIVDLQTRHTVDKSGKRLGLVLGCDFVESHEPG